MDPRKIENRSKTALLRIDGHFGRPKRWKKRGSGDTSKFNEKLIEKRVPVEEENQAKTPYIVLFKITLSASSKKIEKSMQNGPPKVVIFDPKSAFGRPRVD